MTTSTETPELPGRGQFLQKLATLVEQSRRDERPLGVAVIQVQRFREINTRLGFRAGDELLVEVTQRVRSVLRSNDRLARLGDSEFGLILPGLLNAGHAALAANRIDKAFQEPLKVGTHTISVRITMGIALAPQHGDNAEILLQHANVALAEAAADSALYRIYRNDADEDGMSTLTLEAELQDAIEQGGLELHYQPKIHLLSGQAQGFEALTRWTHPHRGAIPPDLFVPLAEQSGLIHPLTVWTLNTALRHCANMRNLGCKLNVAVNLSAATLHNPDVDLLISQALRFWSASPEQLILEITETAMMKDQDRSLQTLRRLEKLGVTLSIDDFGTGYSSLAYLKRLPVGELKIDKSFVHNMINDPDDETIVSSVIELAHNFDMLVVAEGVENQATLTRLQTMGCDFVQGYHIAEPMPVDQLRSWLKQSQHGCLSSVKTG